MPGGDGWRIDASEHPLQITKCYLVDTIVQFLKGNLCARWVHSEVHLSSTKLSSEFHTSTRYERALKKALLRKRRNCQGQGQPDKSSRQGLLGLHVLQDGFMLQGRNPPHHCLSPCSWGKWESSFLSVDITKLLWHQAVWIRVPAVYRNYLGSQALSTRGP